MKSEKIRNIGTAKQLSAKQGCDKNERLKCFYLLFKFAWGTQVGSPPTRKLSDYNTYARQKYTAISAAAD